MGKLLDKLRRVQAGGRPFCTMIVPAAGSSARMGGGDKLMMELEGVPVLVNDPEIAARLMESADRVLGEGAARQLRASPGSDDFSCFLQGAPGVQFRVGTGNDRPESRLSLHNPALVFDEEAVYVGAAVMGQYILDTLCKE